MICERLRAVRERMAAAAKRSGRGLKDVTLIAVSKTKPAEDIIAAYHAGQRDFGENYLQDFQNKRAGLAALDGAVFHFIGKLQSNKTTPVAEHFSVIHTVDSEKLARRLDRSPRMLDVFVEVQLAEEDAKGGIAPAKAASLVEFVRSCEQLRLRGLMCIPPWSTDPEQTRPYFARLRQLGESLGVDGLSMGMSNDFEAAIEEGATMVRVGTAIFGKRQPAP